MKQKKEIIYVIPEGKISAIYGEYKLLPKRTKIKPIMKLPTGDPYKERLINKKIYVEVSETETRIVIHAIDIFESGGVKE